MGVAIRLQAMKIFLTGGTGFVGSHFLRRAVGAGHQVVALRRAGSVPRVPLTRDPEWVEGELGEPRREWLEGCDVLVHLAAHSANVPYDTLEACVRWNVLEPLRLLDAARRAGVRRFVVAGTCFEYGRSADRYEWLPVDAPLEPTDTYPTSKAAASVTFTGWAAREGTELSVLRIFQVYGEGELESRFWPSLRRAAVEGRDFPMSPGGQVRDFIEVTAVADAFVRELGAAVVPGVPVIRHVATGEPQTLLEFAEHWWRQWEARGRLLPGALPYRATEMMRIAGVVG